MKRVEFFDTKITDGFWKQKQDLIRNVTVKAVYDRFYDTGRIDAFKCDKNSEIKPHFFWDSDVAKWIEGVAYLTREKREIWLEEIVDNIVDEIEKNQDPCGYFNIFFTSVEPQNRFKNRDCHELYCLGHLIEAGVAYYEATGKSKLLNLMCKYVDYVEKVFVREKSVGFTTPGHEEIELALVRLYECTKKEKYLELSKFFVDERGKRAEETIDWGEFSYNQSHKPVREQETAEGHAVRAVYLYCAMADLALKYKDDALKNACEKIFDNIINKRMYITGGIGSSHMGEAFTVDYDLSNLFAYTESCAALGLILFANRMLLLDNDSKYSDTVERALYNGFLSSTSLDGRSFFYTNPLEILPQLYTRDVSVLEKNYLKLPVTQRQEVFGCSCCPPNIVRFIPSIGNLLYTYDEDTIYVHQFMQSVAKIKIGDDVYEIEQKTSYPYDGKIDITVKGGSIKLAVRVPYWHSGNLENVTKGYAYSDINENSNTVHLDYDMTPRFVYANPNVISDSCKCAVISGPIVYCMEGHDNKGHLRNIVLDTNGKISKGFDEKLGVPTLKIDAITRAECDMLYSFSQGKYENTTAHLIPYFAFANRGESEMQVWHSYKI
ncbi:MAG: glycoside hydrolase family 127 protein [Clostridia bacterium]|nr:glycoside hydrolase family 127 protein [Clostridia bacterium]